MTNLSKYYKVVEPQASSKPVPFGAELVAEEYRNFLISRANSEYLLYQIETRDGSGSVPLDLRSSFTTKAKAQAHIDAWWENHKEKEPTRPA